MRITLAALLCLASAASAEPTRAELVRANYSKFEYKIPMRDGKRLFTAVYVPNQANFGQKYPFLMTRTPYTVGPYGLDQYPGALGPSQEFEKEGFIFVQQDVRGRWMSEGEFDNMRPNGQGGSDESTDTFDTIDWLLKNVPNHNGRLGMRGISYPGFYTAVGAINSHPALKVISPQAPIADWWRGDDMHRNGAFNLQLAFTFLSHFGRPRPAPTDEPNKPFEYGTTDAYQYFMDMGPLSFAAKKYDFPNAHWAEITAHPNYDDYWQKRNLLPHLKNVNCACMIVGGWLDTEDLYGPLHIYQTLKAQHAKVSLVMGPWNHGGWEFGDGQSLGDADFGFKTALTFRALDLAYFKHHLKEGPDPGLAAAWVFETGANRWRSFPAWPPPQAKTRSLYFHSQETLRWEPAQPGHEEFVSDPNKPVPYTMDADMMKHSKKYMTQDQRFASRRPDVLTYQTEALKEPLTLAGPITADLWVSTTAGDADWVVKLIDVNPGKGQRAHQQTLVRGEPIRGRFREDGAHPKPFQPGQKTRVRYVLNDVFHTFQRGHRVMVQVQSSWFPYIDRNPQKWVANLFEARPQDFIKATHRVYHDSHLELNVLAAPDQ